MPEDTFSTIVRGFDVLVEGSDQSDTFHVSVTEGTGVPWEIELPVNLDDLEGENEEIDGSDRLMMYVSQAAVDRFEGQRGTLGEGAGAMEMEAMKKKKRAYEQSMYWEDWFYKLKGTPFEAQALSLMGQLFQLDMEEIPQNDERDELWNEEKKICYDLNMLNLERMQNIPCGEAIIIIQGQKRVSTWGFDCIQDYLDSFMGDPLESTAISKVKELLDLRDRIDSMGCGPEGNDIWERKREIERQMESLLLTSMEQVAMPPEALTGIESAPAMADDLADLMEGVDLNESVGDDSEVIPKLNPLSASFEDVIEDKENGGGYERPTPGETEVRSPGSMVVAQDELPLDFKSESVPSDYAAPADSTTMDAAARTQEIHDLIMADNELFNQVLQLTETSTDPFTLGNDLLDLVYNKIGTPGWPDDTMIGQVDWQSLGETFMATGGIPMAASLREAFSEAEPVEERIDELGHIRHDLDPGLIEPQQFAFNQNERVRLKRELKRPSGWGMTTTYPKGTLGHAESQYDKQGDYYFVRLDNNHLVKIRWDDLEAAPK